MKALSLVLVLCASVSMAAESKKTRRSASEGTTASVDSVLNNKDSSVPVGSANPRANEAHSTGAGVGKNNAVANMFRTSDSGKRFHFSANIVEMSKGNGGADLNFFQNENLAFSLRVIAASSKENVKKGNPPQDVKITVDRTQYALGATYYLWGNEARTNILIGPAIAFGQKRDYDTVDNQTGISLKLAALARFGRDFTIEGGGRADTLQGDTKTEAVGSIGYLF